MTDNSLKTYQQTNEIESFNREVPELSALIELDELDLEYIAGGMVASGCTKAKNCTFACGTF